MSTPPFVLDQRAAARCPMWIQNAFNPLLDADGPHHAGLDGDGDSFHRTSIIRFLTSQHGDAVTDLREITDWEERTAACLAAMAAGAPIILGAALPADWAGHRIGAPDLLLRSSDQGTGVYQPALIKSHAVLAPTPHGEGGQLIARGDQPFLHQASPDNYRFRIEAHEADLFELAHLWLLVRAAGFAGAEAWGAIIGTDRLETTPRCTLVWVNLHERAIATYAYSSHQPWRKYSALDRYEHEHRFRVRVATRALAQTGAPDDPPLIVSPVHTPECDQCSWWPTCSTRLADDISVQIERSPLDTREILTLRTLGISTIAELAAADVDALLPQYLPRVAHRPGAETRLRLAVHRGRLLATGTRIERLTTGPIEMPGAPVEIDLDIETSANNHVYLWGFLVHDRRSAAAPEYHAIHRFSALDKSHELALAEEAAEWLRAFLTSLGDTPVLVWHYSAYEVHALARLLRARHSRTPSALGWVNAHVADHFVDLLPIVRENFFGVDGLGLKAIATGGAGFSWRDPDPSGLNSQHWFSDATSADAPELREAAKTRILEYNEDDVRATWSLRQWLRSLT